jgi:hypothetical protein
VTGRSGDGGWIDDEFDGDDPYPSLEMIDRNTAVVRYEAHGLEYVVNVDEVLEERTSRTSRV